MIATLESSATRAAVMALIGELGSFIRVLILFWLACQLIAALPAEDDGGLKLANLSDAQ